MTLKTVVGNNVSLLNEKLISKLSNLHKHLEHFKSVVHFF